MSYDELDKFIASYYERVSTREACYYKGKPSSDKVFIDFNNKKNKSDLSIFISDAMILKNLEYDGKIIPCRNPTFEVNCIQFYLLRHTQLSNYIVFRTFLRKGKVPSNRSSGFLILLLMEIINGIYGSSFKSKFNELNRIYSIFPTGADYEDIFKEAFEIIFIQNRDLLKIEEYVRSAPLDIFDNTNLLPDFKDKKKKHLIEFMVKTLESTCKYRISDNELYIFNDCFEYINEKLKSDNSKTSLIESIVYRHSCVNYNFPLRHLMAQYPFTSSFKYININGDEDIFQNGIHTSVVSNYDSRRCRAICYSTLAIFNVIAFYCDYNVRDDESGKTEVRYPIEQNNIGYIKISHNELFPIIKKWINENLYAKIGYRLTFSQLEDLRIMGVKENDILEFERYKSQKVEGFYDNKAKQIRNNKEQEVRDLLEKAERLHGIGTYISPEEKKVQFEKLLKSNLKANEEYYENQDKSKNIPISLKDDILGRFLDSLLPLERKILVLLCNDNFDGADDAAWDRDDLISNVIDRINIKFNKYFECDVIKDTDVIEKFKKKILAKA